MLTSIEKTLNKIIQQEGLCECAVKTKGLEVMLAMMVSDYTEEELLDKITNKALFYTVWAQYARFKDYEGSDTQRLFERKAKRRQYERVI